MSMSHTEIIKCPKCGKESEFTCWDSINTQVDPELKAKVRSGEIFHWICPECGAKVTVNYSVLYHQMEDRRMIYLVMGDVSEAVDLMKRQTKPEGVDFDAAAAKRMEGYHNRVVRTQNELREKLVILDAGLDDHILEIMKLYMTAQLSEKNPKLRIEEFLFDISEDGTKQFLVHTDDNQWHMTNFIQDMYDSIAADYGELINADSEVIIDFDWAKDAMKRHMKKNDSDSTD